MQGKEWKTLIYVKELHSTCRGVVCINRVARWHEKKYQEQKNGYEEKRNRTTHQEHTQNISKHTLHERLRGKGEHPELALAAHHNREREDKDGRGEFDGGECARDEVGEPTRGSRARRSCGTTQGCLRARGAVI